jgi:hypothetical protein
LSDKHRHIVLGFPDIVLGRLPRTCSGIRDSEYA